MTVLIGIYCTDGVVIGADSAATFTHGMLPIMTQQTLSKLTVIENKIIVASSGTVGLGQRLVYCVTGEWNKKDFSGNAHFASLRVSEELLKSFQATFVPRYQDGWRFAALLAMPIAGVHELFEYDAVSFQPERKTEHIRFVAVGSGQPLAEPFLGFISRVFWKNGPPNLTEGIFGALWALRHTIDLNPGGVGGDPQIAVLERAVRGQWRARILSDDERGEHEEHCRSIEDHIRDYRPKILQSAETGEAPDLPRAPGYQVKGSDV